MASPEKGERGGEASPDRATRKADCPCPKEKCERHGDCEACGAHHSGGKSRPFCKR